jgi:hypothetical protein
MIQPNYSPKEALKRAKLMMGYDPSTTLTENQERLKSLIKEDSIDTPTEKSVQKILQACGNRAEAEGTLDAAAIASAFNRAFNYQTLGFMGGTDDSLWRAQASKMIKGNMDDLCNVKKEFEDAGYGDFAQALVDELDDEELAELMETFTSMKYKSDKAAKLAVASTEQYNINWFKKNYPCIFDSDGNVDQTVRKNSNNYVYILIKGTSGNQYQVFADGRVKKMDGTSTGKKVSCNGSKVTFINESVEKKKLSEQIDDSGLTGGGGGGGTPTPAPKPKPKVTYTDCSGTYKLYCKSPMIKKVQACLGLTDDGAWGKATNAKLKELGYTTFKDADVDVICEKAKPEISGEVVVTDPSSTDF